MNSSDVHESKRWYVIAGFGFYPVVGLPWSVACLIRGILTKKLYGTFLMRAALISFVPTVLIIAAYVVTNASLGGMDPKAGLNKRLVSEAISEIEMHKIVTGAYPDSLWETKNQLSLIYLIDKKMTRKGLYYERKGAGYVIGMIGVDGIKMTEDDIRPVLEDSAHLGILNAVIEH
jgi:hypothetical protein